MAVWIGAHTQEGVAARAAGAFHAKRTESARMELLQKRAHGLSSFRPNAAPASAAINAAKKVRIRGAHIEAPFDIVLIPGAGEAALHRAVAARAKVPAVQPDGSESFFFTSHLGSGELVVPLCDGLADGTELTMHLTKPDPSRRRPSREGSPETSSTPAPPVNEEDAAAAKLQAIQRGRNQRKQDAQFDVSSCFKKVTQRVSFWCMPQHARYEKGPDDESPENAEDALVHGMAKMSRLATDMANERTLLAWIRTILAFVRTCFATLSWAPGAGVVWLLVHRLSVFLMLSLLVGGTIVGLHRYHRISKVVKMKDIPAFFGRLPVWPLNLVLGLTVAVIALSMIVQNMFLEAGLEGPGGDID